MCTSIVLFRKKNLWPVIIGTNRDERLDRKSLFPDRYWKEKFSNIVGGKDLEKQGSWIGVNDFGIAAIIHNRKFNKKRKNSNHSRLVLFQKPDMKLLRACPLSGKNAPDIDYKNIKILKC